MFFEVFNTMFPHNVLLTVPLEQRFRGGKLILKTAFVVVSSVDIKRADCNIFSLQGEIVFVTWNLCHWDQYFLAPFGLLA